MDIPQPVTYNLYIKIQNQLCADSKITAETVMKAGENRLIEYVRKEEPHNLLSTEYGELARVAVTVDGTCQKRGHNSKNGVVFVISIQTGEILD